MASLGLEALLNVAIPGLMLFIATTLAVSAIFPGINIRGHLQGIHEWQGVLLALIGSTFFGALIQSFFGVH